ncbi:MAG: DUF3810 domain-containing protein [Ruthenibacterium sp.]
MSWRKNRVRYLALAILGAWLAAFGLLKHSTAAMNWLADNLTTPYKRAVGTLCDALPFSMAEILWLLFLFGCAAYIAHAVYCVVRAKGSRPACVGRQLLGAGVIALALYGGFTLLWGVNYYTDSAVQRMGVSAQPVSVQELTQVTQLFADKLNATAGAVPRDQDGVCSTPREVIFADGRDIYTPLEESYPFLAGPHIAPKPMLFSRFMSEINYTGFFFPFTGEANLNAQQPLCLLPATIAHELAHVRGVAPEQDCNFLAVLACEKSGNAAYAYSGWLLGYIHLSNALYTADYAAWQAVYASLCAGAKADLLENSAFWAQYKSAAATAANTVYEGFLQSYDQMDGLKSYGRVTDLLVAWYGTNLK